MNINNNIKYILNIYDKYKDRIFYSHFSEILFSKSFTFKILALSREIAFKKLKTAKKIKEKSKNLNRKALLIKKIYVSTYPNTEITFWWNYLNKEKSIGNDIRTNNIV